MAAALTAAGVPAHLFTVLARGGGESGTTATAIAAGPVFGAAGKTYESPFAGHGWEGSDTQLVIKTGFQQLFALMTGASGEVRGDDRLRLVTRARLSSRHACIPAGRHGRHHHRRRRRIGAATAREFAAEGALLMLTDADEAACSRSRKS